MPSFFPYHKYCIGERLRQTSWEVITVFVRATIIPLMVRRDLLAALRDKIE